MSVLSGYYLERADTEQLKNEIYSLRYRAYRAIDCIPQNVLESFSDTYDLLPNVSHYLLRKDDGTSIGSIRACLHTPDTNSIIPTLELYNEEIQSKVGLNKVIVESSRFTVDPNFQSHALRYNICLFKAIYLHVLLSNCDYLVTSVRKKHLLFYDKKLNLLPISEEKFHPDMNDSAILVAGCAKQTAITTAENFPYVVPSSVEIEKYKQGHFEKLFFD